MHQVPGVRRGEGSPMPPKQCHGHMSLVWKGPRLVWQLP